MSEPMQHGTPKRSCSQRRRRRPENAQASARVRRKRSRDACPQRARMLDPDHEAFVAWFVQYWSQRGASLFESQPAGKEA